MQWSQCDFMWSLLFTLHIGNWCIAQVLYHRNQSQISAGVHKYSINHRHTRWHHCTELDKQGIVHSTAVISPQHLNKKKSETRLKWDTQTYCPAPCVSVIIAWFSFDNCILWKRMLTADRLRRVSRKTLRPSYSIARKNTATHEPTRPGMDTMEG